ncbi:hypothetical protein, partial [Aureispira sp. CCB-QB1]|uniref:hypothetical protein n=1 Tax=Aureispira sp. CCB-QB1 TaxID=1313421 RepID=UPI0012DFA88A
MRIIYLVLCCFLYYNSIAQITTFNKRVQLGCGNTILTGLEVTDSCYYVTGGALDSNNNCDFGTVFTKYDTLGNLLFYRITRGVETWFPYLRTNFQNELVTAPYFYDSTGMYGGIFIYDNMGGGTVTPFSNPYIEGTFIRPDDMRISNDSGYIITSSINDTTGVSDVGILKLDQQGQKEWHVTRGVPHYVEHTPCVYATNDNHYIIGYQQDNLSGVQMNYTVRSKLEKIDSLGNTIWTYQSPNNQQIHGVNDLILSKDGGLVVASAWGYERLNSTGTFANFLHHGYIYKLDSAQNFLWGTILRSPIDDLASFQKIIELEDSTLVAFGTISRTYPAQNPTHYIIHGRIVKLSPQGDSIWSRDYEYLSTANARHTVYDAERTPDGGFLVCGEANGVDTIPSNPIIFQQGWLIKLDDQGCLVPGCHTTTGVLPLEQGGAISLLLYPNPTTDYLNV